MLPETNKIKAVQLNTETPASRRSEMQPHRGCELCSQGNNSSTGSPRAQVASRNTWFSTQSSAQLPWEETKSMEKHAQETDIRKVLVQEFVVYKH